MKEEMLLRGEASKEREKLAGRERGVDRKGSHA